MAILVGIFEDEPIVADRLEALIDGWAILAGTAVATHSFRDGAQLTESLANRCDILFFDIEMQHESGLAAAARARRYNAEVPIVFTTSHMEYAIQGYQVEAFRYLVKPVQQDDCAACMERARRYHEACRTDCIALPQRGGACRIRTRDILFIEAQEHHCRVKTTHGVQRFNLSFSALLERLQEGTLQQCQRSYAVNCAHIRSMAGGVLTLDSGDQIPYTATFSLKILQKLKRMD